MLIRIQRGSPVPISRQIDAQIRAQILAGKLRPGDQLPSVRHLAGELAINEVTQRTFNDLRTYLETGSHALIDALRTAGDSERPFRQSQIDAAVRFCAKVFGQDYATQLAKAAEVASHVERKAAARV